MFQQKIKNILRAFTAGEPEEAYRWVFWLWSLVLLLVGALVWGVILDWGRVSFNYHDWARITAPRLAFIKNALTQGVFPFLINDPSTLGGVTDRFFTIPDVPFSPQYLLLRWMDLKAFVLFDLLLFYAIGMVGLVVICRKKHLSALTLSFLVVLFNFNGHLLAHFSVGHFTWTAFFLYPWLILLITDLLDQRVNWSWPLRTALLLVVMLFQGGYHQFIYSLFLLGLMVLVTPRYFWTLAKTALFAVLIGMVRLLPSVLNLGKFDNVYIAGYPFIQSIWDRMVQIDLPFDLTFNYQLTGTIGVWEYTLYVGLVAAVGLVGFGLVQAYRNRGKEGNYVALLLPAACLMVLSLDRIYKYVRLIMPLPIFTGERAPSRMISVAFLLVLFLAAIEFQRWLDARQVSFPRLFASGLALVAIFHDIWQNIRIWAVSAAGQRFQQGDFVSFNAAAWVPVDHPDPMYWTILGIGAGITILALSGLIYLSWRDRPRRMSKQVSGKATVAMRKPATGHLISGTSRMTNGL